MSSAIHTRGPEGSAPDSTVGLSICRMRKTTRVPEPNSETTLPLQNASSVADPALNPSAIHFPLKSLEQRCGCSSRQRAKLRILLLAACDGVECGRQGVA